jgi:hypothetical protein
MKRKAIESIDRDDGFDSPEKLIDDAWRRMQETEFETEFLYGKFEAYVIPQGCFTSDYDADPPDMFHLIVKEPSPHFLMVVERMFHHFQIYSDKAEAATFRVVCGGHKKCYESFPSLDDFCLPEGWMRFEDPASIFFHRGPLTVEVEIRGIKNCREGDDSEPILDTWTGRVHVPGVNTTILELKNLLDDARDSQKKDFKHCPELKMNHFLESEWTGFHQSLQFVELHPFEAELLSYRAITSRWRPVLQKQNAKKTIEGDTAWSTPLKDLTLVSNYQHKVLFVAYAVFESEPLM